MFRQRVALGTLLASALLVGGLLFAEEQQGTPKGKGKLPPYWSKLGLSDEQKQKTFAIQAEYKEKIDPLRKQITKLEQEERRELAKILTDSQKDELKRMIAAKALSEPEDKDKKGKEKPKDEKPSDK